MRLANLLLANLLLANLLHGALADAALVCGGLAILNWMQPTAWWSGRAARLALAHLLGAAAMAWIVTVFAMATGRLRVLPVYCVFALLGLLSWRMKGRSPFAGLWTANPPIQHATTPWEILAVCAVVLAVVTTGWGLTGELNMTLDAHFNWALKAKAMFLAGSLHPIAAGCCTKPNYPILFPLQIWWIDSHLRHVDDWWPQAAGFVFYLDLVVLTFNACRAHMRPAWAWTATAIVAGDPIHVLLSGQGQPDSALAACILASSIFLAAYLSGRDEASRAPALLLLFAALQTKNEGLAWATFAIALIVLCEMRWRRYTRAAATCAFFLIAVAPWTLYKLRHHMTYGPEEQLAGALTLKLEWAARLRAILLAHLQPPIPGSPVFVLLLCLPLLLRRWAAISKPLLALIAAQLLAYLAIYFIVADQPYQLHFVSRGVSQIAPALICICLIGYHAGKEPSLATG